MGCHSGSGPAFCQPHAGRPRPGMQAAFALLGLLPPPAAGTMILAGHDGPGAGGAADAGITLLVKAVEGQLARAYVGPDLVLGPIQQRADFLQAVLGVPLDGMALGAGLGLLATHTGDPGVVAAHELAERHHLAHAAAGAARLGAVEEAVDALTRHQ